MKLTFSRKAFQSILLIGIVAGVISFLFLWWLDRVVHTDLYSYGLQFSYDWANRYWTYIRLTVVSIGIVVAANCLAFFYLWRARTRYDVTKVRIEFKPKLGLTKIVSLTLFGAGLATLAASLLYSSSILAFIGLGLIFWGAIFLYIRSEKYIQEALLDKTTFPSLLTLNQMIAELGFRGQAVYLPPKYFKGFESSKAFISARGDMKLPPPEKTQDEEDKMFIKDPNGVLITPPGIELKRLFEKTLGTSFTRVDLQYLEQNIPKLLVEDLEIAQGADIETENDRVLVKMKSSIYQSICKEAQKLSNIYCSLGCPLCSAIACALAEATGKPVVIKKDQIGDDGRTTKIEYGLLEPKEEQTQK